MEMCITCNIEKELEFFTKDKRCESGFSNMCKSCTKEYKRIYNEKNKEKISNHRKEYRDLNKEKISTSNKNYYECNREKIIETSTNYNKENKEKVNSKQRERYDLNKNGYKDRIKKYYIDNLVSINKRKNNYDKQRKKTDILYKLYHNIRSLILKSIKNKGFSKKSRTFEILGCSFEEFKIHIESKFEPWMNWSNHGKYTGNYNETWQYDHIIPIDSAINEDDIIKLNHYTNFQPLCSKKNQNDKSNKLDYMG